MIKLITIILVALLAILPITTVLAIANPSSSQVYSPVYIYRHLLEDNDMLVVAKYNITYSANPDENVTQAYLGRIRDDSNVLGSRAPYTYYNDGYGDGIFSIYFSAADAPTWGQTYTVEIVGNPVLHWPGSPPVSGTQTTSSSWIDTSTHNSTIARMGPQLLTWASELETSWNLDMVQESASGLILTSTYGVPYFTNVIANLRTMGVDVFPSGVDVPEVVDESFTQSYSTSLADFTASRWSGTSYGTAFDDLSSWVGISSLYLRSILFIILVVVAGYIITLASGSFKPTAILLIPLLGLGNYLGFLPLSFTIVLAMFAVLGMGYIFFYRST